MRFRFMNLPLALLCAGGLLLGSVGCSDDETPTPTEMVTVSGIVIAADNFSPAEDVCVFLLDHEADYISAATNANGEYTVDVPKGSPFLLTTDDCDAPMSTAGTYYPTINVDTWHTATIEQDYEGYVVHTSFSPTGNPDGSLKAYQNFLTNSPVEPTVAKDFYAPVTDINDVNGWMFFGTFFVDTTSGTFFEDQTGATVTWDETASKCPTGYVNYDGAGCDLNADGVYDVVCPTAPEAPNILQTDGGTATDDSANVLTFCDPASTATELDLTVNAPNHAVTTYSVTVPLRPNTCSLLFLTSVDGTEGTVTDVYRAFGIVQ